MSNPLMSPDEWERLNEIADLDLTSQEVDEILTSITDEAAETLGLPISLVSIVLDEAQYFLAAHGLKGWLAETRGTSVDWAFCKLAVQKKDVFVVEDALNHPAVEHNPLVTDHGIRCYLGVPLITQNGNALGTLCVIGTEPRSFTAKEHDLLREFASRAIEHIERRAEDRRTKSESGSPRIR